MMDVADGSKGALMQTNTVLAQLIVAVTAISLASCKQDQGSKKKETPAKTEEVSPKGLIARVPVNPKNAGEAKIEFVAVQKDLKDATPAEVEAAFKSGLALNVQTEGNVVTATEAISGQSFSLFGCQNYLAPNMQGQPGFQQPIGYPQPGYQQPITYQQPGFQQPGFQQPGFQQPIPYQQPGFQQPGFQQPITYQQPGFQQPIPYQQPSPLGGSSAGSIFQSLLGSLGIGTLFGNLMPNDGILGQLLGLFQNSNRMGQFMQTAMQPMALPYGQPFNQALCNTLGYSNPNAYPTIPGQSYTPGYGPVPYGYSGQYQTSPYNYYSYGQVPGGGQFPGGYQPMPYGQQGGIPQGGVPPQATLPSNPYTYTPYPNGG
jgi:hypothetical protein